MNTNPRYEGIEYEIRKEQANTLGIAGKQLQSALEEYEAFISMGKAEDSLHAEQLLDGIAQKVYALLFFETINERFGKNFGTLIASI